MKKMGLEGAIRGRRAKTKFADKAASCPLDHINRKLRVERPSVL